MNIGLILNVVIELRVEACCIRTKQTKVFCFDCLVVKKRRLSLNRAAVFFSKFSFSLRKSKCWPVISLWIKLAEWKLAIMSMSLCAAETEYLDF